MNGGHTAAIAHLAQRAANLLAQPNIRFLMVPREMALSRLREAGLSVPTWAKANGFNPATVKAVLYGHSKGLRGEAHRVAVALGVKTGVVVAAEGFRPVRRTAVQLRAISRVES